MKRWKSPWREKPTYPVISFCPFPLSRNLIVLDGKGNIVWEKYEPFASPDQPGAFWDFKKHVVDGETYYSYHDNTGTYDNYGLTGYGPGERVILDKDFNEIKRITFEASDVVPKGFPLDGHDFLLIDLDHYILNGYMPSLRASWPALPMPSSASSPARLRPKRSSGCRSSRASRRRI